MAVHCVQLWLTPTMVLGLSTCFPAVLHYHATFLAFHLPGGTSAFSPPFHWDLSDFPFPFTHFPNNPIPHPEKLCVFPHAISHGSVSWNAGKDQGETDIFRKLLRHCSFCTIYHLPHHHHHACTPSSPPASSIFSIYLSIGLFLSIPLLPWFQFGPYLPVWFRSTGFRMWFSFFAGSCLIWDDTPVAALFFRAAGLHSFLRSMLAYSPLYMGLLYRQVNFAVLIPHLPRRFTVLYQTNAHILRHTNADLNCLPATTLAFLGFPYITAFWLYHSSPPPTIHTVVLTCHTAVKTALPATYWLSIIVPAASPQQRACCQRLPLYHHHPV